MSSREHYTVNAQSLPELINTLNFTLARLADRIDKMEGVRGTPTFESDIDMQSNKVTDASAGTDSTDVVVRGQLPGQSLETSDGPTFNSMTILGDLVVGDDLAMGGDFSATSVTVSDTNDTILHSFGVN